MVPDILKFSQIIFRQGKHKDCQRIAELDSLASGGAIDFLFRDLVPGLSPVQIVAHNFKNDFYPFTYKSAIVAEYQKEVIGFALSFPAQYHCITDEMRAFFPPDRLEHFKDFFSNRVENSYYLDAFAVAPSHQRCGIGKQLMALTMAKAKKEGFDVLSLIVFADNTSAIPFYEQCGFKTIKPVELEPHELIPHQGGCLLMAADIP